MEADVGTSSHSRALCSVSIASLTGRNDVVSVGGSGTALAVSTIALGLPSLVDQRESKGATASEAFSAEATVEATVDASSRLRTPRNISIESHRT
jgi:hypothetical protein